MTEEVVIIRLRPEIIGEIDEVIAKHGSDELVAHWSKATANLTNTEFCGLMLVHLFLLSAVRSTPTKRQFEKILREVESAMAIMSNPGR